VVCDSRLTGKHGGQLTATCAIELVVSPQRTAQKAHTLVNVFVSGHHHDGRVLCRFSERSDLGINGVIIELVIAGNVEHGVGPMAELFNRLHAYVDVACQHHDICKGRVETVYAQRFGKSLIQIFQMKVRGNV